MQHTPSPGNEKSLGFGQGLDFSYFDAGSFVAFCPPVRPWLFLISYSVVLDFMCFLGLSYISSSLVLFLISLAAPLNGHHFDVLFGWIFRGLFSIQMDDLEPFSAIHVVVPQMDIFLTPCPGGFFMGWFVSKWTIWNHCRRFMCWPKICGRCDRGLLCILALPGTCL